MTTLPDLIHSDRQEEAECVFGQLLVRSVDQQLPASLEEEDFKRKYSKAVGTK